MIHYSDYCTVIMKWNSLLGTSNRGNFGNCVGHFENYVGHFGSESCTDGRYVVDLVFPLMPSLGDIRKQTIAVFYQRSKILQWDQEVAISYGVSICEVYEKVCQPPPLILFDVADPCPMGYWGATC